MVSSYFYKLMFSFVHLGVNCVFSVYRTGLTLAPNDNDARPLLDFWRDSVLEFNTTNESPTADILNALRNAYGATTTTFTGLQVMYYRQSVASPLVANASFNIAGTTGTNPTLAPSGQNSVSYYAPASEYRVRGAGFRLPCPADSYMSGNGWDPSLFTSSIGDDTGSATWSLLEILNSAEGYQGWSAIETGGSVPPTTNCVVKRVPNNAPHGNGNGYRLPTFPPDTVKATWCDPFGIQPKVGTAQSRRQ